MNENSSTIVGCWLARRINVSSFSHERESQFFRDRLNTPPPDPNKKPFSASPARRATTTTNSLVAFSSWLLARSFVPPSCRRLSFKTGGGEECVPHGNESTARWIQSNSFSWRRQEESFRNVLLVRGGEAVLIVAKKEYAKQQHALSCPLLLSCSHRSRG